MADEETKDEDQPVTPQGPSAILGLVLVINGKEVTLNSDTITDIQKNGLDLGITEPVYLGTFSQMIDEIKKTFNVDIPIDPKGVPPPLDGFLKNVENLGVTIVKAHIKVHPAPAVGEPEKPTQYTLVMTVLEQGSTNLVDFGPFGVKGFVIGVTNEPKTPAQTSNPPAL